MHKIYILSFTRVQHDNTNVLSILSSYRVLEILRVLSIEPKTKEDLRSIISSSHSSLLQILNRMIKLELIERKDDTFRITPKG